jgi:hypothetical protein
LTYETDFQDGYRPSLKQGGLHSVDVSIAELPLAPGLYSLDLGSRSGDTFTLDYLPGVAQVEVAIGRKTPGYIVRQGAGVRLNSEWNWNHGGTNAVVDVEDNAKETRSTRNLEGWTAAKR